MMKKLFIIMVVSLRFQIDVKMKKTILCIFASAMVIMAGAQGVPTRISGHLEIQGDSLMVDVIDLNLEETHSRSVYPMNDGNFDFTVSPEHISTVIMRGKSSPQPGQMMSMKTVQVMLMPGEDAVVNGTIDNYTISGSQFYDDYRQVRNVYNGIYKDINRDNYEEKMKELQAATLDYIKAHPKQEAAMTLISTFQKADEMKETLQLFDPSVREGRMQYYYKPILKRLEAQQLREENAEKIVEGALAPDFTLPQMDGKQLSLSSLRGKYVILDFWGSWCHWCIKGFPDMKKYYEKYKGKLEILGVDCNDTEEKWKAAVKEHQPSWLHVRQSQETTNVSDLYGVQGFPTKIVIDPEGRIAKVVLGESPEFYEYLDNAFGKSE